MTDGAGAGLPVFLVGELPGPGAYVLDGPEGRHAATVRRLARGEQLRLTDGSGGAAHARVTSARRDELDLEILAVERTPPPAPLVTVVQALPKGDRGELAVQLLTEAGVDTVVPWQAERCVTRWQGERGQKALERWRSAAREAAKQARRTWLPDVRSATDTRGLVERLNAADPARGGVAVFVLHEQATEPLSTADLPVGGEIVLVVGPEGGIAPAELDALSAVGARAVRLGPTVLRTSTAGLAGLAVVCARTGRWG